MKSDIDGSPEYHKSLLKKRKSKGTSEERSPTTANEEISSPLRKRLRSCNSSSEVSSDLTKSASDESSVSSNLSEKKVCITLCKVSNSTDCYSIKKEIKTDGKPKQSKSCKETEKPQSTKRRRSCAAKSDSNDEQQATVGDVLDGKTYGASVDGSRLLIKEKTDGGSGDNLMPTEVGVTPACNSPARQKSKLKEKSSFISHLGLTATANNENNSDNTSLLTNEQWKEPEPSEATENEEVLLSSPTKFSRNSQYYGTGKLPCPDLGEGWYFEQIVRQQGKSAGQYDVYYYSPTNVRLRSKLKLTNFIGDSVNMKNFDYNIGRFLKPKESISKKDALHTDKLQWLNEGKVDLNATFKSESGAKESADCSNKENAHLTLEKPLIKVRIKRGKYRKRHRRFIKKSLVSEENTLLPNDESRNNSPSVDENNAGNTDETHLNEDFKLSETEVETSEDGLPAFKNDMLSLCSDILKKCSEPHHMILQAWKCLRIDKKSWFKELTTAKQKLRTQSTTELCSRKVQPQSEHGARLKMKVAKIRRRTFPTLQPHKSEQRKRSVRCKVCAGCLAPNCGKCSNCRDMRKFGGPGTKKQGCLARKCIYKSFYRKSVDSTDSLPTMVPLTSSQVLPSFSNKNYPSPDNYAHGLIPDYSTNAIERDHIVRRISWIESEQQKEIVPDKICDSDGLCTPPQQSLGADDVANSKCRDSPASDKSCSDIFNMSNSDPKSPKSPPFPTLEEVHRSPTTPLKAIVDPRPADFYDLPIVSPQPQHHTPFVKGRTPTNTKPPSRVENTAFDNAGSFASASPVHTGRRRRKSLRPEHIAVDEDKGGGGDLSPAAAKTSTPLQRQRRPSADLIVSPIYQGTVTAHTRTRHKSGPLPWPNIVHPHANHNSSNNIQPILTNATMPAPMQQYQGPVAYRMTGNGPFPGPYLPARGPVRPLWPPGPGQGPLAHMFPNGAAATVRHPLQVHHVRGQSHNY